MMRMVQIVVVLLGLVLAPALASAYGGGGEGTSSTATPSRMDAWSPSDLNAIFSGVSPSDRSSLVTAFTGSTITKRDLLTVRQVFLERNASQLNNEAAVLDAVVKTLEVLDAAGQVAQQGLSYVPGVGWVTAAGLSAARSGADAYQAGKSAGQIVQDMVISGSASALVGKFSPLNADASFNTARAGFNLARQTANSQVRNRAIGVAIRALGRFGVKKEIENNVEAGIGSAMNSVVSRTAAQNYAQPQRYTPSPSYNPMDSVGPSNIAGGTPQL